MAVPGELLPEPMIALVTRVQASFVQRGQSLADDATAETYRITLGTVALILDGALATGTLTTAQHETLRGMIEAAEQVPSLL